MDALRLWNIALAGTACGNLLTTIENAYGYPKSKESKEQGLYFKTIECEFTENAPEAEPATGLVAKEVAEEQERSSSSVPPKKECKKSSQSPDKLKLKLATPIFPSMTVGLHQTGVSSHYISERARSQGQSVYRCMYAGCDDVTAQHAQCHTHMHCKHLRVCIQCRLCPHRSYRSVDIQKHLRDIHQDQEDCWFEPTPDLKGDIVEVSSEILKANIALVKQEAITLTEEEDEEDEED